MKITSEDQITFENPIEDNRTHYQDIVFNGEVIGALCERERNLFVPIDERYQICVPESEKNHFDGWYISEDKGKILGYFHTLEKFIEYYNSKLI